MEIMAVVNASVDPKWKFYLHVPTIALSNVAISHDQVGMINRRYDNLLNSVAKSFINNVNAEWSRPFDITSLDPLTLPFLSNMIVNLHLSPFYQNEFLYFGFSYFVEQTVPQMLFSDRKSVVAAGQKEAIWKMYDWISAYMARINAPKIAQQ
jgi:hypothetical protein